VTSSLKIALLRYDAVRIIPQLKKPGLNKSHPRKQQADLNFLSNIQAPEKPALARLQPQFIQPVTLQSVAGAVTV
jgi:hypothetical protein